MVTCPNTAKKLNTNLDPKGVVINGNIMAVFGNIHQYKSLITLNFDNQLNVLVLMYSTKQHLVNVNVDANSECDTNVNDNIGRILLLLVLLLILDRLTGKTVSLQGDLGQKSGYTLEDPRQ